MNVMIHKFWRFKLRFFGTSSKAPRNVFEILIIIIIILIMTKW
jgi:hypothetical protein